MDDKKRRWKQFKTVILVLLLVLVIGTPIFAYFRITTEARLALREAKNAKLHIEMLDVQLYASGLTVFDSSKQSGLSDSAYEELKTFMDDEFALRITSYSKKLKQVTGFVYTRDNYQVVYTYDDQKGDCWKVNYLYKIFDYSGED